MLWKVVALSGVQTPMKTALSGDWGSFALGDKQSSGAGCLCQLGVPLPSPALMRVLTTAELLVSNWQVPHAALCFSSRQDSAMR